MKKESKTKIINLLRSISKMMGSAEVIKTYSLGSFEELEHAAVLIPVGVQSDLLELADELEDCGDGRD